MFTAAPAVFAGIPHQVNGNAEIELPAYPSKAHDTQQEQRRGAKDPKTNQVDVQPLEDPFADPPDAQPFPPPIQSEKPDRCCLAKKRTILGLIFTIVVLVACIVAGVVTWKKDQTNGHRSEFECGNNKAGPECTARFQNGGIALDYQEAWSVQPGNGTERDEYRVSIPEWLRYNCYWAPESSKEQDAGSWKCSSNAMQDRSFHDSGEEEGGFEMTVKAEMHLEPGTWVEKCEDVRRWRDHGYAKHCWRADEDLLLPPLGSGEQESEWDFECGRDREAPSCYAYYVDLKQREGDYVQMATEHAGNTTKYFRMSVPNWLRLACLWVPAGYEEYVYGVSEGAWMCGDSYLSTVVPNMHTTLGGRLERCDRAKLFYGDSEHCWSVNEDDGVVNLVPPPYASGEEEDGLPVLDLQDILDGRN